MRIAVNTRLLLPDRLEGIGRFTDEILKRVVRLMGDHEFTFLFDRPYDEQFIYADNVRGQVLFPQARHPILYRMWFDYSIPAYLARRPHDLFLSTDGYIPLRGRTKRVNVIHDINFEHFDGQLVDSDMKFLKKYIPRFAHHADRLLTVSEFSRFDIAQQYRMEEDRIEVVPNGVGDIFRPADEEMAERSRLKWTNGVPYFIYVGSMNRRKNIEHLLRSFDRYCSASKTDMRLVMVGSLKRAEENIHRYHRSMTHARKVIFTGRLDDVQLAEVMSAATALTFVPLFEGFGIPVIEAFASGVPVICSKVSSLPEVAQDAAIYVDPYEEDELVAAMHEVVEESTLRQRLIDAGHRRADFYNWDRSAEKMASILQEVLDA